MGYHHEIADIMEYSHKRFNVGGISFFMIWILLCSGILRPALSSDCNSVAKGGLKHAQCDNKGFQVVPQDLDHDIKVLELRDNEISYLQLDTFRKYKSLQQIFLARNRIEEIAEDAFRHLDNLQRLDLESNKLKFVPSLAFKHLHSVRMLIMKGNPITFISRDAFQHLPNIEVLDFENCWLTRIDAHAFRGLNNLREINLVNNDLRSLKEEMQFSLPDSLYAFRLYRNKWNCDCKLRWLLEWLKKKEETCETGKCINWHFYSNTPMCHAPEMINEINWIDLQPDRFACASDIIVKNSTYDLVVGSSITIECEVKGDPPPEVTWEKGSQIIDEFTDPSKYKVHVEKNAHKLWSRLTVLNVNHSDTGEYKCTAKNLAGQSSVTYVVREPPPPPAPKETTSKGMSLSIIIAIAVGGGCVLVLIIVCSVYLICRNYNRRHAYKVRNYKTPSKGKQQKKEKARFDDEEQAIVKENDKRVASAATQLLEEKKKEQEKELVKEFYKETDIATGPIVCNDVRETEDQKGKEFKMKIFTKYEEEDDDDRTRAADLPSPHTDAASAATDKTQKTKAHCNNIKEVTPDLLKTQQHQMVPNHRPPSEPNHIQSCLKKRAEENPYAKPSDLRPGATLPKKQSRSAEDLLDTSRDGQDYLNLRNDSRSRTLAGSHSPNLRHRHDKHDTSPCSNPICLKDQDAGGAKSPTGLPKPHIKTSQSMGGIQGKAADDSCVGQTGRGHSSGKGADKYATLPSKPRQGILHNGNPSRTTTYGVRFPDDTPGSPPSNPSKSHTYQHQTGRPAKSQLVHHVSPTRTPIPKYHPQIIRGTNTATSGGRLPPKHNSRVTSPASSDHSGEFSPQRPFTSTSLDDILSPPFGNPSDRPKNSKKSQKLPKPGEKDEFGTAV